MQANCELGIVSRLAKSFGSCVLVAVCAWIAPPAAGSQSQPLSLSLGVLDDRLGPVAGANLEILVLGTGASHVVSTDRDGYSPLIDLSTGDQLGVILGETKTANGVALGQYLEWVLPQAEGPEEHLVHQVLFQPSLETVTVASSKATLPGNHLRWMFIPSDDAKASSPEFCFAAEVGPLLTTREIHGFESYYGIDFGSVGSAAKLGLVIRTSGVDIGELNLAVRLDVRGHGFASLPTAHTFVVRRPGDPPAAPTFSATAFEMAEEHVYLMLAGVLEKGDNIILLTAGGPTQPPEVLQRDEAPSIPVSAPLDDPPAAGPECPGGVRQPVCPVVSDPTGACTPDPPSSDPGCAPATPTTSYPECKASSFGGPRVCDNAGSLTVTVAVSVTGSVSIGYKMKLGVGEVSAQATGSVTAMHSQSQTTVFGPGNSGCAGCNGGEDSCGQCRRLCMDFATCSQSFTVTKNRYEYDFIETGSGGQAIVRAFPCEATATLTRSCYLFIGTNVAV